MPCGKNGDTGPRKMSEKLSCLGERVPRLMSTSSIETLPPARPATSKRVRRHAVKFSRFSSKRFVLHFNVHWTGFRGHKAEALVQPHRDPRSRSFGNETGNPLPAPAPIAKFRQNGDIHQAEFRGAAPDDR